MRSNPSSPRPGHRQSGRALRTRRADERPDQEPKDREERKWWRELVGVAICAGLVLIVYHQVAFGGKTFDTSSEVAGINGTLPSTGVPRPTFNDLYRPDRGAGAYQTVPWAQVIHREISHGEVPWWNPDEGAGEPLAGNAQSAVLDPLMLAVDLHPTTRTWDLTFLFYFMLGSAATYLFLRALDLSMIASIAGAGAFTMSGFFAVDTSDSFVRVATYVPILFLAVELAVRSPKVRWVGLLGAATAGCILAGMPEVTFFALAASGSYALYRIVTTGRAQRAAAAVAIGGGGLLGLMLAAPFLIVVAQYVPLSANVHSAGVGLRAAGTKALLNYVIPFFDGPPAGHVPGAPEMDRAWVGMAAAVLAVTAASAPSAIRRRGGWFFAGLAAVVLLKVHDVRGFQWIGTLPVINRLDSIAFSGPVPTFCLVVLAAIGIQAIASGQVRRGWLIAGSAALGAAVVGLVWVNRSLLAQTHGPFHRRDDLIAAGAGTLALVASVAATVRYRALGIRKIAAALAAVAVLAELYLLFPQGIYAPRSNPFNPPPWLPLAARALSGDPAGRVFGVEGVLYPDTAGALGLQDPRTLNALYVSRYATFVRDFVTNQFTDRFVSASQPEITANPMFDLLGARVVLSQGLALAQSGAGQYRRIGAAGGIQVFRNNDALPRAFMAATVHRVDNMAAAVAYLRGLGPRQPDGTTRVTKFNPGRQAVVEAPRGSSPTLEVPPAQPGMARSARIVSYRAGKVVIQVPAGPRGLLVLSDSYFPGWQATVNGHAVAILPTDVAFRGVMVGRGASRIVFAYHPPGGNLIWALPLLGLIGLASAAVLRAAATPRPGRRTVG